MELWDFATLYGNSYFHDDSKQQDVSEWIEALLNAIETILQAHLQIYLRDLFLVESTTLFKCPLNHQSQNKAVHNILQLPMKDEKGNILLSLNEILNNNFQEESLLKNCDSCHNTTCRKWETITKYPKVLLLQYK